MSIARTTRGLRALRLWLQSHHGSHRYHRHRHRPVICDHDHGRHRFHRPTWDKTNFDDDCIETLMERLGNLLGPLEVHLGASVGALGVDPGAPWSLWGLVGGRWEAVRASGGPRARFSRLGSSKPQPLTCSQLHLSSYSQMV